MCSNSVLTGVCTDWIREGGGTSQLRVDNRVCSKGVLTGVE